ncbi:MAG: hypothetical protein ABIB12_01255 [Patescibacteria group bacterium]
MTPIVSLIDAVTFGISVFVAVHLYGSYRKAPNIYVKYFFFCFVFVAVTFLLLASPGIITTDSMILAVLSAISNFTTIGSVMYFTLIPLLLLRQSRFIAPYAAFMALVGLGTLVIGLTNLEPYVTVTYGRLAFWLPASSPIMDLTRAVSGVVLFLSLLAAGGTFIVYGVLQGTSQRIRSVLLGGSALLFALSGAVNFILGAAPAPGAFLVAAFLSLAALLVLVRGIFYRPETSEWGRIK